MRVGHVQYSTVAVASDVMACDEAYIHLKGEASLWSMTSSLDWAIRLLRHAEAIVSETVDGAE